MTHLDLYFLNFPLAGSDITLGDFANSPDARARLKKSQSSGLLKADELICEDWAEADDETFSTLPGKYLKESAMSFLIGFFHGSSSPALLRIRDVYTGSRIRIFSIPDSGSKDFGSCISDTDTH